jgi:membrane protease YdiL (CAAX protease family)
MFSLNFLLAVVLYIPWAMLQQTLFQFYLLGRLRALLPFASPLFLSIVNGIAYGLVHFETNVWSIGVTVVTIIGGIFWSYSYHRDRYVLPIAVSHALLGSTFYYWVYGRDLIDEMRRHLLGGG